MCAWTGGKRIGFPVFFIFFDFGLNLKVLLFVCSGFEVFSVFGTVVGKAFFRCAVPVQFDRRFVWRPGAIYFFSGFRRGCRAGVTCFLPGSRPFGVSRPVVFVAGMSAFGFQAGPDVHSGTFVFQKHVIVCPFHRNFHVDVFLNGGKGMYIVGADQ